MAWVSVLVYAQCGATLSRSKGSSAVLGLRCMLESRCRSQI